MRNPYLATWLLAYDDPTPPAPAAPPVPVPADPPTPAPTVKSFSQDEVNSLVAKEKREGQARTQSALDELHALRTKSKLTVDEKTELDSRIETLQSQIATKEQLAQKAADKLKKEAADALTGLEEERDNWKNRYTSSAINRNIVDAAAANNAFVPSQVVAILSSDTRLVEVLDDEGHPTGQYIPRVNFSDTDKEGKPVTLDLTVPEVVKRMTEMDEYLNLFKGEGSGGIGRQNKGSGGKEPDLAKLARDDPQAYRKLRAEQMKDGQ